MPSQDVTWDQWGITWDGAYPNISAPLNSLVESGFQNYLLGQNISNLQERVYRYFNSGSAVTPCVFVIAQQRGNQIGSNYGGTYRVPFEIRIVYVAQQLVEDPEGIDRLTHDVEQSLQGAVESINDSPDAGLFIYDLTMKSTPNPEVAGHTYQYPIALEAVCTRRTN